MSRFVEINNRLLSVDKIAEVVPNRKGYTLIHTDGRTEVCDHYEKKQVEGIDKLIQVIPCNIPIVAVYDNDGELFEEDVFFLGLYESGQICGLTLDDGYFVKCEDACCDFKRLYYKNDTWRKAGE